MNYRRPRYLLGALIFALLIGGPMAYSWHRHNQYRNFRIVEDGKLYRSGQMGMTALKGTYETYGIKTVINFESTKRERPLDAEEEKFCAAHGIRYIRIRPREWRDDGSGRIAAQESVDQFLKVMDDSSVYPALIHCFAGTHRTGSYCAIYRMEYQHWKNSEALEELKALGYDHLDTEEDVRGYLENYAPRWKRGKK